MLPNTLSLLRYFTPYRSYPFGKIVLKGLGEVKVFPRGSTVKNPPAMQKTQEMQVQSLNPEDPLEEGMATHSIILAWRISVDGGAWQPTVQQVTKSQTRLKQLSKHTGICFCVSVPYLHS